MLLPTVVHSAGLTLRTLAAAALAGVVVLVVAAAAAVAQMPRSLRDADLAAPSTRPRWIARSGQALLLVQTTLSVVLLAGTGLFGRSLHNLMSQEFGMRTGDVLLVEFDRGPGAVREQEQLYSSALERIRTLPGVEIATTVKTMPFTGFHVPPISVPGLAGPPRVNGQLPFLIAATPQFLDILDIAIVEGRRFAESDERGAPVVIVNQTMARSVWPGESALGKCIRIGFEPSFDPSTAAGPPPPPSTVPCREVIGVSRDVRQRSVVPTGSEDRLMQYFVPFSQVPPPPAGVGPGPGIQGLLLRTTAGPGVLAAPIRRVVLDGRTDLPFLQVRRYSELLERQMRPWRLGTALLSLFGALGARRSRGRALRNVCPLGGRAAPRDGDPSRRRRAAAPGAGHDPAGSRRRRAGRRAVRSVRGGPRRPMDAIDVVRDGPVRSAGARIGGDRHAGRRDARDVRAGASRVAHGSDLAAARGVTSAVKG